MDSGMMIYFIILAALVIADGVTSAIAMKRKGVTEGNKLMASLFDSFGVIPVLFLVKLGGLTLVLSDVDTPAPWMYIAMIILYLVTVVNNIRVLIKSNV